MAGVELQTHNRFSVLDTPPYESTQILVRHEKGALENPAFVSAKLQRNRCDPQVLYSAHPRQNGNCQPNSIRARGQNDSRPPRFQNRQVAPRFCGPSSRPTSSCVIDPSLAMNTSYVNMQLKKQLLMIQQPNTLTCTMIPPPTPQNLPLIAQHSVGQELPPRAPGAICRPPMGPRVSIPPPGLSRPNGPGMQHINRSHIPTKPVDRLGPCLNQMAEKSNRNSLVVESRPVFPTSSTPTPHAVKLPVNQDTQHTPPSPASTACSLPGDPSGFSSVPSSDTTFTSVGSNVSTMPSWNGRVYSEVCRNWLRGYPCHWIPCRFSHPERPKPDPLPPSAKPQSRVAPPRTVDGAEPAVTVCEPSKNTIPRKPTPPPPSTQTQPPSAPLRVPRSSVTVSKPNNNSMPRKKGPPPPSADVEPPQRPEPLYAATIEGHIKVRFDQGFEVRDVVTGFESRWVHLGNVAASVTSAALNELLGAYNVDTINMPESSSGKPVTVKVQFSSAADAIKAVTDLNGTTFSRRTILAKLAINNSTRGCTVLADTDVQLAWECPSRVGYVGYDTLQEAKVAIESLNGFPFQYVVLSAQLYEGLPCVGAYNVIINKLPASVTELDLRKFANSKAVMLGRPNYDSLDKAIRSIRSRLEEYGTVTAFDVIPPPFKDGMVKAWAHFTSPAEARAAQDDLDRRRPKAIGHTILSCRHVVSVSHVLSASSYRKMREDIGWLRWSWQRRYGPSVSIRERSRDNGGDDAPAYIKLSSEQPEQLSRLKYEFEQLLHGETVTLERKPLWDDFLITDAGRAYVAQVQEQYPGVQIKVQTTRRVISLWGPIVMRHRARKDIVLKLTELKARQFWKIPLTGKLLGIFCSAELATLQGLLGPENCIPDFGERVLVVRGNDLAFRTACAAVQEAQSRQGDVASSSSVICPVCFGEAVVPVSLACGHRWCRTCLTGYLTSAVENKMFPLKCLGNDATCTQCIPLGLSRKLLSAADFDAVIEAAFWVYVHGRPDEFHNCPTPDCTQVYRSAPRNAVLQCPSCLVRICPACRIEYHDDLTCEERDVAEDKLFNEWTSNHDVKSCPGCKAPIERSEGCNHMTCTRCQTHICWECLATFPRGQGIYDHMRLRHGGIGL